MTLLRRIAALLAATGALAGGTVAATAAPSPPPGDEPVPADLDLDTLTSYRTGEFTCLGTDVEQCVLERGDGLHVFVLGDGDAAMMVPMFRELARDHDLTLSATAIAHCPWQLGLGWESDDPAAVDACVATRDDVYQRVLPALRPDIVVTMHLGRDDPARPNPAFTALDPSLGAGTDAVAAATARSLDALESLGAEVVLIEPVPFGTFNSAQCLAGAALVSDCAFETGTEPTPTEHVYRAEADARSGVFALDLDPLVCPSKPTCLPMLDGELVYRDAVHIMPPWLIDHRAEVWSQLQDINALG